METLPPIPRGMFKFRKTLVNQLWSHVKCPLQDESSEQEKQSLNEASSVIGGDETRPLQPRRRSSSSVSTSLPSPKKKHLNNMLMRLKKCYLEVLLEAINSDGAVPGGCVLIPVAASTTSGTPVHLLMSQVFRWPDVYQESELKRLSFCELYSKVSDAKNQEKHATFDEAASRLRPLQKLYECCNPFHWSRLQKQRE